MSTTLCHGTVVIVGRTRQVRRCGALAEPGHRLCPRHLESHDYRRCATCFAWVAPDASHDCGRRRYTGRATDYGLMNDG